MKLHPVEAGCHCISGRGLVVLDDSGDFIQAQRARYLVRGSACVGVSFPGGGSRGRGHRLCTGEARVDYSTHVPELSNDAATALVHRVCHTAPTIDLLECPHPVAQGQPKPWREMPMASVMIKPAEAR